MCILFVTQYIFITCYFCAMAEDLKIVKGSKQDQYEAIIPQIKALIEGERDIVANLGNTCAALKEQFNFLWIGFYIVKGEQLVLGPFQGPVACTRIGRGKGVCGTSWSEGRTLIVRNVEEFPGHIACSSSSKAEIVVPVIQNDQVVAVLDVDSEHLNYFDETDKLFLEEIVGFFEF